MRNFLVIFCIIMFCGGMTISAQEQESLPTIKEVQQSLADRGFDVGIIDGAYGSRTSEALKEFQKLHKLNGTGFLNLETAMALRLNPPLKKVAKYKSGLDTDGQSLPPTQNEEDNEGMTFGAWVALLISLWVVWMIFKMFRWFFRLLFGRSSRNTNNDYAYEYEDEMEDGELTTYTIEISTDQSATDIEYKINTSDAHSPPNTQINIKKSKANGDKCWVPKGQSVSVSGITITSGMIYVGSKLQAQQKYHGIDNCLINTKVKVARNTIGASDDQMPYWPSYSDIPPKHRRLAPWSVPL